MVNTMPSYPRVLSSDAVGMDTQNETGSQVQHTFDFVSPHMEIRQQSHADRMTPNRLQEMVENMWPSRRMKSGPNFTQQQKAMMLHGIFRLQTFGNSVKMYAGNMHDVRARESMQAEARGFLSDIAARRVRADWIDDVQNETSVSYAFARLTKDHLIAAGITTADVEKQAFESALPKRLKDPTAKTRRKWAVKLFPERMGEILEEKLSPEAHLKKVLQAIRETTTGALLSLFVREELTTREEEWRLYLQAYSWKEERQTVYLLSFDEFLDRRRAYFSRVVECVLSGEACDFAQAKGQMREEMRLLFERAGH